MIKYGIYQDIYYNDLKKITLESFELTSFCTDTELSPHTGGRIAWELWLKPVLESDKKKYCIVASTDKKAVGYIVYGADAAYSKVINKKIGNIILLAVKKEFRGKYKIAQNLVVSVLNLFKSHNFDIITVGTDLDNLPAVITYINLGFKPILCWSTFRYHFDSSPSELIPEYKIVPIDKKKLFSKFLDNLSRPVSLLIDKKIPHKDTIVKYIKNKVLQEIENKQTNILSINYKNKISAFFSFVKKEDITRIIGKNFCTINDLIFLNKNYSEININCINTMLNYLYNNGCRIAEIFVQSNEWQKIKYLCKAGFMPVHNAVTLHKHL